MNEKVLQSNFLHDLKVKRSLEAAALNFPNSLLLDGRMRDELNRFKKLQWNPQLLLQTLLEMERQKRPQIEVMITGRDVMPCTLCHICGVLLSGTSIQNHLEAHNEHICDKENSNSVVVTKLNLKRRVSVQQIRPLRKMKFFSDLQIGSIKKSHICKTCGKSFVQKVTLLEHLRIHTGEKPLKCMKRFRQRSDLGNYRKK